MNPSLIDPFGRRIDYVRVSVTDRCDLRCSYCLPKGVDGFESPSHWLSFDEITRLMTAFSALGTRRIRLTGGEPLTRKHLAELVGNLAVLPGVEDISLSTNATLLAAQAADLKAAGLQRLNISLDTLDREKFARIVGRDVLPQVLAGIAAAQLAGFKRIKLNAVALPDTAPAEIEALFTYAIENELTLRLIEPMPMGDTGRTSCGTGLEKLRLDLADKFGLVPSADELGGGPARYWKTADGRTHIGFITPMSQHFCATCNRVRLTVEGALYLCLGQEDKMEFRDLLRRGASPEELQSAIHAAIAIKPERHEFVENPAKLIRFMARTGG
ncbi:MAG: GTP 3',8-cyclase MoaA [Formivibrio sp.]|nr:GTP 3',8-cyclase MoaA [Formivibrio sp.]